MVKTVRAIQTRVKRKLQSIEDKFFNWVDRKVTEFVMTHLDLEETILCAAAKATKDKCHLTSLVLLGVYYIWRAETKFKILFTKRREGDLEEN